MVTLWVVFLIMHGCLSAPRPNHGIPTKSRIGNERDLMVVLPVMQGNTDLTNMHLQRLYTKPPVTAIIGQDSSFDFTQTSNTKSNPQVADKRIDLYDHTENAKDHHRFTNFLFTNPTFGPKPSKSPLDYGYPETFKFVQELNELPKNHKPEWALTDFQESNYDLDKTVHSSTQIPTKGNPFEMFESVKPLEINKMLSFKPIIAAVTDSVEEVTKKSKPESIQNNRTKSPALKRPTKKPPKTKPNPVQKLNEVEISFFTSSPTKNFQENISADSDTTKIFLPTPYIAANEQHSTFIRQINPGTSTTELTVPTTATTTIMTSSTTTTPVSITSTSSQSNLTPNLQWANSNETTHSFFIATPKSTFEVQPFNFAALSKILGDKFNQEVQDLASGVKIIPGLNSALPVAVSISPVPSTAPPPPTTTTTTTTMTTKSLFPEDSLSPDVKNMLIALGIIKSEAEALQALSTTTTSTENYLMNVFGSRDSATPTIDPISYSSFKKIPIDNGKSKQKVSDDMKELLTSFGLIPKKSLTDRMGHTPLIRISREYVVNDAETSQPENNISVSRINSTLAPRLVNAENVPFTFDLLQNNSSINKTDHVFQPSTLLESLNANQAIEKINKAIHEIQQLEKTSESTNLRNLSSPVLANVSTKEVIYSASSFSSNLTNFKLKNPDPLSSEELQYLLESNKNEVKRQEPSSENSNSTSTTSTASPADGSSESDSGTSGDSSTSTTSEATTVSSNNSPDLASVNGGGESINESPVSEEPPPPQRPNGLYFYVDWNTFLNVGEEEKNPIRIRFSPRAGNARNFLNITVP